MHVESFCRHVFMRALLCLALAGCDAAHPPEPATAAPAAPAATFAESGARCEEGDIECDERMYQLEETLAMYEAGVAATVDPAARDCWRADVDTARRSVAACNDITCRQNALLARIASLHDLQPAERRAAIDLPPAPLLVAVIGPEPEAAPPGAEAGTPDALAARGQLVHSVEDPLHMGIAVRTDSGQEHAFILDADLGSQAAHQQVQGLVGTSPAIQVLVRGTSRIEADGVPNFDASRCRLVYQLR